MKSLVEYINEAKAEFKDKIANLKYETKKPTSNQDDYVQIMGNDKHFWNTTDPVWVKVEDLGKYTNADGLMSVAYNLCKSMNDKITHAEIGVWDGEDYNTFAVASLQKKDRMWHPEWIKSDKYPFK